MNNLFIKNTNKRMTLLIFLFVIFYHIFVFYVFYKISPKSVISINEQIVKKSKITINNKVIKKKSLIDKDIDKENNVKKIQKTKKIISQTKKKIIVANDLHKKSTISFNSVLPKIITPKVQITELPIIKEINITVTPDVSNFLPNSKSSFYKDEVFDQLKNIDNNEINKIDKNKYYEETIDVSSLNNRKEDNKVVIKRYNFLQYEIELQKKFSSIWGAMRYLPIDTTFYAIDGETIAYNIVINKDGSLKNIINISKLNERNRDYTDVDFLVSNVFKETFPLKPLPDEINDPFVLTISIVYSNRKFGGIFGF